MAIANRMLHACPGLATKACQGGCNETTRLYQGHRFGCRGGCHHRRAGDRAVDAGDQMAHDDELAEIAGYHAWRRRADGQGGRRSHRQQIPDPDVRRRRNRARACKSSMPCKTAPSKSGIPPPITISARIRRSPSAPRCRSAQHAAEPGLVHAGRRQGRCSTNSTRTTTSPRCSRAIPVARWAAGSARRSTPSTTSRD